MRSPLLTGWMMFMAAAPTADANHVDIEVDNEFRDHFEDIMVAKVNSPTDLEFTPDGKFLFITQKEGKVWFIDVEEMDDKDDKVEPRLSFEIPHKMCLNGARGLQGIGIHPEYPAKRWVYLFFNRDKFNDCGDNGPVNQLSRFELNDDNTIDGGSEVVFFTTPRLPTTMHNSGDISFGKDGYLYITVGDGGARPEVNGDGVYYSQALDMLVGKIVRLTEDGNIPEDNPFTPAMGETKSERCNEEGVSSKPNIKCQEIYATGLRNPYRFAMDPNADETRFFINDVGRTSWERILPCGDSYAGANYGFPYRQGPCASGGKGDAYKDCGPSEFVDPVHWYEHDQEDGGAVTGGAFVSNDIGWPETFQNSYLYSDYAYGGIYRVTPGGKGCPYPKCDPPISDFSDTLTVFSQAKKVVSIQFGPHKEGTALYYVTRDHLGNRGEAAVFRIAFTGDANRAPKAQAVAEPMTGFAPLTVQFDATLSKDPDGDSMTYSWDFDGDGVADSIDAQPLHVFTKPGTYTVKLTAKDGKGGSTTTTVRIDADNTPPVAKITSPAEGTTFAVGDVFTLVGSATDNEEGELSDTQLTWEVRQHHNTHYHPFLDPTAGNNIELWPAPPPEDFDASTTSYLAILLTATDSTGLSTTTQVIVQPKMIDVNFDTNPSGLHIIADGDQFLTPITLKTWANNRFKVTAPTQTVDGTSYGFDSWSNGVLTHTHDFVVPATDPEPLTADFEMIRLVPLILSPMAGTTFAVGDSIKLEGSAVDEAGNHVPDAFLTWEIQYRSGKHLKSHHHFLTPTEDNFFEIKAPGPQDLMSARDAFLEVFLTVSNGNGKDLSTTTSIVLEPRRVDVDFDTIPSGLDVVLDGETFTTPISVATWYGTVFNIKTSSQQMDGTDYVFGEWSDEGRRSHRYAATSKDTVVAAFERRLPKPEITSIAEGTKFAAGDKIKLKGSAVDSEGDALPDMSLSWEVRVYNAEDDSYRTILEPTQGNNIKINAPQPADLNEGESGHIEILLTATDSNGLSSRNRLIVDPHRIDVVFETIPSGFYVIADGHQLKTPVTITTWENNTMSIEVPRQRKREVTYAWEAWSDGGTVSHEYSISAKLSSGGRGPRTIVATLAPEEPSSKASMLVGVFACIAVLALLAIVLVVVWKRRKRGIPISDMNDMSSHGDELKSIDAGMLYDADESTRDGSQEELEEVSAVGMPADFASSSASVGATSTKSFVDVLPIPINLSRYLLSSRAKDATDRDESRV